MSPNPNPDQLYRSKDLSIARYGTVVVVTAGEHKGDDEQFANEAEAIHEFGCLVADDLDGCTHTCCGDRL